MTNHSLLHGKTFRRFAVKGLPLIVPQFIITAALFLIGNIIPIAEDAKTVFKVLGDGYSLKHYFIIFYPTIERPVLIPLAMVALGILFGIVMFAFLDIKRIMNIYYSVGLKRSALFGSVYTAGAVLLIIPAAVPLIINVILNSVMLGSSPVLWTTTLYVILIIYAFTMFGYTLAALCAGGTGTITEAVLGSVTLASVPFIFGKALALLSRRFLKGSAYGLPFSKEFFTDGLNRRVSGSAPVTLIPEKYSVLNTFVNIIENDYLCPNITPNDNGIIAPVWFAPGAIFSIISVTVLTVLLAVCAFRLFKNRKAEFCGMPGANKGLNIASSLILGFYVFCITVTSVPFESAITAVILSFIVFILFCILLNVLTEHSFRKGLEHRKYILIPTTAICGALVIFATGAFGYSSYIPKADEVKSARITAAATDCISSNPDDTLRMISGQQGARISKTFSRQTTYNITSNCTYLDESEIQGVISLHERFIKSDGYKRSYPLYQPISSRDIAVSYTLKNGKTITRYFRNLDDKTLDDAVLLRFNTNYKNVFNEDLEFTFNEDNVALYVQSRLLNYGERLDLSEEQKTKLFNAVKKDVNERTPEEMIFPKQQPLCYLGKRFIYDGYEAKETYFGAAAQLVQPFLTVTEDMTETINLLRQWGYSEAFNKAPDINCSNIKKITVSKETNLKKREDFIPLFVGNMSDPGFYGNGFGSEKDKVYEDEEKVLTITDKQKINAVLDNIQFEYPTTRGGYVVLIELQNPIELEQAEPIKQVTAYLPENSAPEFVKKR